MIGTKALMIRKPIQYRPKKSVSISLNSVQAKFNIFGVIRDYVLRIQLFPIFSSFFIFKVLKKRCFSKRGAFSNSSVVKGIETDLIIE